MGVPDNQANVVLVLVLAVFVFGIDPLLFWSAFQWTGLGFWQMYLLWLAVVALGVTIAILRYLMKDEDKTPPQPRKIVRIT